MSDVDLVGKTVLIGLTYRDPAGRIVGDEQVFGPIISASGSEACVRFEGSVRKGEKFPIVDVAWLQPVNGGAYTLKATGEIVHDPDFTLVLSLTKELDS